MTALPASTDFTGASITEAQFKAAITSQREYLAGLFGTAGTAVAALQNVGALGCQWLNKTAAYTVVASDLGRFIGCSGTFTLGIDSALTLGGGFSFALLNYGTGVITIDPSSTETIDGASTLTLDAGESCIVMRQNDTSWRTFARAPSNGELRSQQVFTSSGTWTKPTGLKRIKVTLVGGGGGAANIVGTSEDIAWAGAGGGAAVKMIEAASLGSSVSVTVGAAGAGGTGSTATSGSAGGTTSFGSHCSATGGGGGAATATPRPVAGSGTGGDVNYTGGTPVRPYHTSVADSSLNNQFSDSGGSSFFGPGAAPRLDPGVGAAASNYGAGGGTPYEAGGIDYNGGAGKKGIVIVEEFF